MIKKLKERDGFTFIELIAVLMIIVILAAVTTPKIFEYVETARKTAAISGARNVINAVQAIGITKGDITEITLEDLQGYFANAAAVNVADIDNTKDGVIRIADNQALGLTTPINLEEGQFALSSISSNCSFTYYQKLNGKLYAVQCENGTVNTTAVAVLGKQ